MKKIVLALLASVSISSAFATVPFPIPLCDGTTIDNRSKSIALKSAVTMFAYINNCVVGNNCLSLVPTPPPPLASAASLQALETYTINWAQPCNSPDTGLGNDGGNFVCLGSCHPSNLDYPSIPYLPDEPTAKS